MVAERRKGRDSSNRRQRALHKKLRRHEEYDFVDDMKQSVNIVAKFFANNPPSIMLLGGVVLYILAVVVLEVTPQNATIVSTWAFNLVIVGFVLQMFWMFGQQIARQIIKSSE
ncbi:MAG: hypothetical protein M1286_01745 [Candidatus Marsarchaeota archaeon]|nr:hypothetical protein [Candidatus Marsarchaeota archaeon]